MLAVVPCAAAATTSACVAAAAATACWRSSMASFGLSRGLQCAEGDSCPAESFGPRPLPVGAKDAEGACSRVGLWGSASPTQSTSAHWLSARQLSCAMLVTGADSCCVMMFTATSPSFCGGKPIGRRANPDSHAPPGGSGTFAASRPRTPHARKPNMWTHMRIEVSSPQTICFWSRGLGLKECDCCAAELFGPRPLPGEKVRGKRHRLVHRPLSRRHEGAQTAPLRDEEYTCTVNTIHSAKFPTGVGYCLPAVLSEIYIVIYQ